MPNRRIRYRENPIRMPLQTGVRVIDGLLTTGLGQRVGIFGGSGVGKSTLLGMIARYTSADINVIALIGERGREVREFIENDLGAEGLKRSVVLFRLPTSRLSSAFARRLRDCSRRVFPRPWA
jgi:flagellar biosynthesis/type III secretory pathway ATPase